MSVENKVITATFDNSKFERNIRTTIGSLNKFKMGISKLVGSNKTFQELGKTADSVKVKFSSLQVVAVSALENIANSAISTGKQLLKSLSVDQLKTGFERYSNLITSIQTIKSANADRPLKEINAEVERLSWFTDETSYNMQSMVATIGKFTAAGRDFKTSVTTTIGFFNAAAEAGVNAQTAVDALNQASQTLSKGFFGLNDWREAFGNRGMDTRGLRKAILDAAVAVGTLKERTDGFYQTVSKGRKFTADEFDKYLTDTKWLTTDVLEKAMATYGKVSNDLYEVYQDIVDGVEGFEGNDTFTKEMVESYKALADAEGVEINTTTDLINIIRKASSATEELKEQNKDLLDGIDRLEKAQVAKTWEEVVEATRTAASSQWSKTFELIFGDLDEAKKNFTGLSNDLWDVFADPIVGFRKAVSDWKKSGGFDLLWSRDENNLGAIWNIVEALRSYVEVFKTAIEKIFGTIDGDKLIAWTEKFRGFTESLILDENGINKWANTIKRVYTAFKNYYSFVKEVVNTISIAITGGGTSLRGVLNTVAGTFSEIFGAGRKVLHSFNRTFKAVMKQINGAFKDVFGKGLIGFLFDNNGLVKIVTNVFDTFAKNKTLLANIGITAKGLLGILKRGMDLFERIGDALSKAFGWKNEGSFLVTLLEKIFEFTAKIFGDPKVQKGLDSFEDWFVNTIVDVVSGLKSLIGFLKELWNVLFEGKSIGEVLRDAFSWIKGLFGSLGEALGFDKNGEQIMHGLADGIRSGIEWVKTAISDVAFAIINIFKDILGIHSPSTEGEELGEQTGKGIGIGIKESLGFVLDKIKDFSNTVLDVFKTAGSIIHDTWFNVIKPTIFKLFGTVDEKTGEVKNGWEGFTTWLSSIIKSIGKWFNDLVHNEKLIKFLKDVGDAFMRLFYFLRDTAIKIANNEKIKNFFKQIGEAISSFFSAFTETGRAEAAANGMNKSFFYKFGEAIVSIWDTLVALVNNIGRNFSSVFEFLAQFFENFTTFLKDDLLANNWGKILLGVGVAVAAIIGIVKLIQMLYDSKYAFSLFTNVSDGVASFADVLDQSARIMKQKKIKLIGEAIKEFAIAIAIVVASFVVLAGTIASIRKIDPEAITASIVMMGIIVGAFSALTIVLAALSRNVSEYETEGKGLNAKLFKTTGSGKQSSISASILIIGLLITELATAISVVTVSLAFLMAKVADLYKKSPDNATGAMITTYVFFGGLMAAMMGMVALFQKMATSIDGRSLTKNKVKRLTSVIVLVTNIVNTAANTISTIAFFGGKAEKIAAAAGGITVVITAIFGAVVAMSEYAKRVSGEQLGKLIPLLAIVALVVKSIGGALSALTLITAIVPNVASLYNAVIAISLLLGAMIGTLAALGAFNAGKLMAAAGALSVLSLSLMSIATSIGMLLLMMKLVDPKQMDPHGALWSVVGALVVLMGALTGVMAILSKNESMTGKVMAIGGAFAVMGIGIAAATASLIILALAFKMFMTLAEQFKDTADSTITGFFDKVGVAIKAAINNFFNVIFALRERILEYVVMIITDIARAIVMASPAIEQVLVQGILSLIRIGYRTLPAFNEFIMVALYELLKTVLKHLPNLLSVAVEIGVVAFEALLELLSRTNLILIQAIINFVISAIPILVHGLGDAIDVLADQIPILLYRLANAIYRNGSKIFEAAKEIGNALTYTIMYGIGSSFNIGTMLSAIFGGLVSGFKGEEKDLTKATKKTVSTIPKTANKELKINSPSKVMMEVGKYTVEGLVNGINNNQKDVKESAVQMGKNVDETYRNYMGIHSAAKRTEVDGVYTVEGLTKGTSDPIAIRDLRSSAELLARHIGSTYTDTIDEILPDMVDKTRNAALAQATTLYTAFGPEYFYQMYGENSGMKEKYMNPFIAESERIASETSLASVSNKSEVARLKKEFEKYFHGGLGTISAYAYAAEGINENLLNSKYISFMTKEELESLDKAMKSVKLLTDVYDTRYGSTYASAIPSAELNKFVELFNSAVRVKGGIGDLFFNARKQYNSGLPSGEAEAVTNGYDPNKTPLENLYDLLQSTKDQLGGFLSDISTNLGVDKLVSNIKTGFMGALGLDGEGSFLDSLTGKLGGLLGIEEGSSFFDKIETTIPSAEDLVPAAATTTDAGSIFNGDSYGTDYSTTSYYASGAAYDAASAKGGAWGRVSNVNNSDNSTYTINVYSSDPDAAGAAVNRYIQNEARRRSESWR